MMMTPMMTTKRSGRRDGEREKKGKEGVREARVVPAINS